MKITIIGKNLEISEYLESLVGKKVGKLERYFKPETEAVVTLSVEKNRHICEVTIPFEGSLIRGEEVTGDMYASIDNVLDKLEKQIHRHRTKLEKKLRAEAFSPTDLLFSDDTVEVAQPVERRIVRTKRFDIKPMSVEEAVMQMDLLGHSFFVFTNAITNDANVLYLRADGNLGLIEPDYDGDED